MSIISRWRKTLTLGFVGLAGSALIVSGAAVGASAVAQPAAASFSVEAESTLTVSATPRLLSDRVYLSVSATNNASVPVNIVISTVYGGQTFNNVAPGQTVAVSVNSRLAVIPAGFATITATGVVDGETFTETQLAPYGGFPVEVVPRTLAGRVHLSVTATNTLSVPATIVVTTDYGNKTFTNVAPGTSVAVSINSRLTSVPAGQATITATGVVGGEPVTQTRNAPYGAYTAGQ